MNKVKFKIVMLLLVAVAMTTNVFVAVGNDTIQEENVWYHISFWKNFKKNTQNQNLLFISLQERLPDKNNQKGLKEQIDSLFTNNIEAIYSGRVRLVGKDLDEKNKKRMDIPENDTLKTAIVTLFKIHKGELTIWNKPTGDPPPGEDSETNEIHNKEKEQGDFLSNFSPYILFTILLLGLLYLFFMLIRIKFQLKQEIIKDYNEILKEKLSNLKESLIEELKKTVETEPKYISEIKGKLAQLSTSIKEEVKEPKEAKVVDMPSKPDEVKKVVTIQYYFTTPSIDTFQNKVPQEDFDASWIIEASDENAQTGAYKVNENKKSQLLSNADMYLKPFLDIQNMNEVSKPTRIEYLSIGKVTRTAEGHWRITEKAKVNLL